MAETAPDFARSANSFSAGVSPSTTPRQPVDRLPAERRPAGRHDARPAVPTAELLSCVEEYLIHCEYLRQSPRTLEARRMFLKNLVWFLEHRQYPHCGVPELRRFFHYLQHGHEEPGGRWGNSRLTAPLRPVSIKDYYVGLQTFCKWLVQEEILASSPLEKVERPRVREEVKQPLSDEQVQALLRATRGSTNRHRDEAILLLLLDSGIRASELIGLKVRDMDVRNGTFEVVGKGRKRRTCYFGKAAAKSLMAYLRRAKLAPNAPLFPSTSGSGGGRLLTRSGLRQLVERLANAAGVQATVHQMRRTFATSILQNGSDLVAVRDMLGHSSIHMTLKYLAVSQSHIEAQHRQFSPADRLRGKTRDE